MSKDIPRLVGTMNVHQIFTDTRHHLKHRQFSCFCDSAKIGFCKFFDPQSYFLKVQSEDFKTKTRRESSSYNEVPLSEFAALNEIQNLPLRKRFYETVYGNSSDSDTDGAITSTSNKENVNIISVGDFLHVNVYGDDKKK